MRPYWRTGWIDIQLDSIQRVIASGTSIEHLGAEDSHEELPLEKDQFTGGHKRALDVLDIFRGILKWQLLSTSVTPPAINRKKNPFRGLFYNHTKIKLKMKPTAYQRNYSSFLIEYQ